MKGIQNLRVDYSGEIVDLKNFNNDPIIEFKNWFKFAKNNEVIEFPVDQSTLTKRYTEEVISFIKKSKDSPFFIFFTPLHF